MKKIFFTFMLFCMVFGAATAYADVRPEIWTGGRRFNKFNNEPGSVAPSAWWSPGATYVLSFPTTPAPGSPGTNAAVGVTYTKGGGSAFTDFVLDLNAPMDISGYNRLTFWVKVNQDINNVVFKLVDMDGDISGDIFNVTWDLASYGGWKKVSVDLTAAAVTANNCDLNKFRKLLFIIESGQDGGQTGYFVMDEFMVENTAVPAINIVSVVKPEPGTTHRVSWPVVAGATLYEIWFDDNTDLDNAHEDGAGYGTTWGGAWPNGGQVHGDNPAIAFEDIANRTDNDWYKIRYKNAAGVWSAWSTAVKIGGTNLSAPVVSDISDSDRNGKYDVDWSDVPGAAFYQIQESTSSAFPNDATVTSNSYPAASVETYTHNDTKNTTYYYRVRSYSGEPSAGGAAGPWSSTKYYTTGDSFRTPTSGDIFPTDTWEPKSGVWVNLYRGRADGQGSLAQEAQTHSPYNLSLVLGEWYYIRAETEGYIFPSENVETWNDGIDHGVVFQATTTELSVDIPMDPGYPIEVEKKASKNKVTVGDIITCSIEVENKGRYIHDNVLVRDSVPAGFKMVEDSVQLTGGGTLNSVTKSGIEYTFDVDGVPGFGSVTITYQMIVGAGAPTSKRHDVTTYAWHGIRNWRLALDVTSTFLVEEDPLFDRGLIIGKVFNDRNKNGYQDRGEEGLPSVKLATEQGIVVYTDKHGRYNIPALSEGRHLVKIDKTSLPSESEIISEETYLINTTPGLTSKVNFAVYAPNYTVDKYNETIDVLVQETFSKATASLSVSTDKSKYEFSSTGKLLGDIEFLTSSNFASIVKNWELLIFDQDGENISFLSGDKTLPSEIKWNGTDSDTGELVVEADKTYYYILKVYDAEEKMASTSYASFATVTKGHVKDKYKPAVKPALDTDEESKDEISLNNYSAIKVSGEIDKSEEIYINGRKAIPDNNGKFTESIVLPYGKNYITLTKKDKEGRSVSYIKEVNVKENYMFMVGLAEGELKDMNLNGNVEAIGNSDNRWRDEFHTDGKVAYYLKAKVKGKYIITSSLDSDRQRKELFTNLDPEKYYPVYGDDSTIEYDAHDTQGAFYVLVEFDDSFAKWGNYETDFNDTVFARYNRSLYGGKVHFQSVEKTKFDEPTYKIIAFDADVNQLSSHDELLATGGSLYYLRHQKVIEGSEKVIVRIKDKFSGLVSEEITLSAGKDYRIDYDQGRIILDKPLSMITRSRSLISDGILNGHSNYLVVDYEYEDDDIFDGTGSIGVRATKSMGDHIQIGGTYVREDKDTSNHRLEGVDTVVHLGKNTTIKAEYTSSYKESIRTYSSVDGGLTYANISPVTGGGDDRRNAVAVRLESNPVKDLRIGAYYSDADPGFSSNGTADEQGMEKLGAEVSYKFLDSHTLNLKHDQNKLIRSSINDDILGPLTLSGTEQDITTLQIHSEVGKFEFTEELQHRKYDNKNNASVNTEEDLLAAQVKYNFTDQFSAYIGQQLTLSKDGAAEPNDQSIVGIDTTFFDGKLNVSLEERVGSKGDSTILGIGADLTDNTSVYTNLSTTDTYNQGRRYDSVFGTVTELEDDYKVYSEEKISSYENGNSYGTLLGADKKISDYLSVNASFERSNVEDRLSIFERNTIALGASYYEKDLLKVTTKFEFRKDRNIGRSKQFFTANRIVWDLNESIELSYKLDFSHTKNETASADIAKYWKTGIGFAYRPVDHDWLNIISKYVFLDDAYPYDYDSSDITYDRELANIFSTEVILDLNKYFSLSEKFALKQNKVLFQENYTDSETYLWVNRLNYHVMKKWDIGLEYRILRQNTVKDKKEGFLLEVNRKIGDYINCGVGYNFTEFTDDLENRNDYDAKGWFIRLSAQY